MEDEVAGCLLTSCSHGTGLWEWGQPPVCSGVVDAGAFLASHTNPNLFGLACTCEAAASAETSDPHDAPHGRKELS